MMKKVILAVALLAMCGVAFSQSAQLDRARANGWEFELRAGANIGGALPVPMLEEVRSIESYKPGLNGMIEAVVTKWFKPYGKWGIMTGLRFEEKGMKTTARVKNYMTKIEDSGDVIGGVWTGEVFTSFSSTYLAIPIQLVYRVHKEGKINGGFYFASRLEGNFSGYVSDGHFRKESPIGEKLVFGKDNKASYDFNDDLTPLEVGMQIGGSWRAYKHFSIFADLKYSFTNIFKSDSYMVGNHMHPLYLTVGFSYLF